MVNSLASKAIVSKIKIFYALQKLLETQGMESTKVVDICREAGVGKTTFYTYFKDKYEIVQWYIDLAHAMGAEQIGRSRTWESGHRVTTKIVMAKRKMLSAASKSNDTNSVNPYSIRWRIDNLRASIVDVQGVPLTRKMELEIPALAAAELKLIEAAIHSPNEYTIPEVVDALVSIVPQDLYEALKNPVMPVEEDPAVRRARAEYSLLEAGLGLEYD